MFTLLHKSLQKAIEEMGHTKPTPIQEKAIPLVLDGIDLQASAETGTGKTAAFLLPSLHRLSQKGGSKPKGGPRMLVLVPTRELAVQVAKEAEKYGKHLVGMKTVCIYGGMPYALQNRQLTRPYDILVATPGRLIDHMERGRISLKNVEILVLDEADRMLDMGFLEQVETIASRIPVERQTLLFSATLKGTVLQLSKKLLRNPQQIVLQPAPQSVPLIEEKLYTVDNMEHKERLLQHFLNDPTLEQVIVFTATKMQADDLADKLCEEGLEAAALHGDMNQRQRNRAIQALRKKMVRILVATDVAARGIDIPAISHVINFDLPMSPEDYVHRIGRTGRAGSKGMALSFVSHRDRRQVLQIENFTGRKLSFQTVYGLEPKEKAPRKKKGRFRRYT